MHRALVSTIACAVLVAVLLPQGTAGRELLQAPSPAPSPAPGPAGVYSVPNW